jgi:hypothetical protein
MMINEGMLRGGDVAVSMKKGELIFDVKKKPVKTGKKAKMPQKIAIAA